MREEIVWQQIRDLFEPRLFWDDQNLMWVVECWSCELHKSFMMHLDAKYYLKGHSVTSVHRSQLTSA